ncbi:hypothetical protein Bca52824_055274 [Brassica carinata]|uniref:Zinc knuckle CX2CX4HX4C domain-containing protein n=1 Tax=Brassica carinata TaxID=52824 RepID=A0A8X7UMN5_BRACI|nr:hypothetical protein Bca52824_055274 [Brassica carinata]
MSRRYSRNEKEKWVPSSNKEAKRSPVRELGLVSDRVATDARVRVNMNGLLPLIMKLEIRLPSDEITTVEFEYLKIEKHCFTCFSLFHEEIDCPVRPRNPLPPKERKIGITQRVALQCNEADKKRHDDRRGYSRYQHNPRSSHTGQEEYRDHRSYSSREEYRRAPPRGRDSREPHWNPISERSRSNKESSLNKLSSGKIVSSREKPSSRCLVIGPSGDNTSRLIGSQSSHTPPPRPLRERLEYPTEPSSERTLSTSRERRSALARISEPDLRDKLQSSSPYNMEIDDSQGRVVPAPRASATLRIQESEMDDNVNVNITIPASLQRSTGKRRVPSARKKVPRSPLQSLRLKKTIIAKSQVPARRRLCKDKDYTLPCNKAGPSVIPRSVTSFISFIYGAPAMENRATFWAKLSELNSCRRGIIQWAREQNLKNNQIILQNQEALEEALSAATSNQELIDQLTSFLITAYKEEESFWLQRSRIQWLKSGDSNTGFFPPLLHSRLINFLSLGTLSLYQNMLAV